MKKGISLVSLMMLFVALQSFAQVKFGVLGGLNLSNYTEIAGTSPKSNTSFHIGGIAEYGINEKISVQSGLLLSIKGAAVELSGSGFSSTSTIKPQYLEVPITVAYKIDLGTAKLQLFGGPYIGIGIGGKIDASASVTGGPSMSQSTDIKFGSDLARTDFGLNIGAGIEYNNILLRAQYGLGLSNVSTNSSSSYENRVIGISLGYMFGGK